MKPEVSIPKQGHKQGVAVYTGNPSTEEDQELVQDHPPWLHSNFEASLGYVRLCLKEGVGLKREHIG